MQQERRSLGKLLRLRGERDIGHFVILHAIMSSRGAVDRQQTQQVGGCSPCVASKHVLVHIRYDSNHVNPLQPRLRTLCC